MARIQFQLVNSYDSLNHHHDPRSGDGDVKYKVALQVKLWSSHQVRTTQASMFNPCQHILMKMIMQTFDAEN